MASQKLYRTVVQSLSAATNIVSGSTAASSVPFSPADKGVELTIQNQSTGVFDIYIGDSSVSAVIGSTATTGVGGIKLSQGAAFTFGKRHAPSAIQVNDYWIASTSTQAVAVSQLVKAV